MEAENSETVYDEERDLERFYDEKAIKKMNKDWEKPKSDSDGDEKFPEFDKRRELRNAKEIEVDPEVMGKKNPTADDDKFTE